ncbi:MAG: hypothetical protein PHT07_23005 [Paludibacter sp.]|nr:hypothetical protein [Paludibacter sp.]
MKEVSQQNSQLQQMAEAWIKPEIVVFSITEKTQGLGGGGPDFGSELES